MCYGERKQKNNKMKICVVTTSFTQGIINLINFLSSKYEFHVIYVMFPSSVEDVKLISKSCNLHAIRYPYKTYSLAETGAFQSLAFTPLFVNMLVQIRRVIKRYNIDLIQAHWAIPAGFLACLVSAQIPVITTLRGSDINKFGKRQVFKYPAKYALKRATKIIALSNDLKEEAIKLGARDDKIWVIPGGVDTDKFKPQNKNEARVKLQLPEELLILFVGVLTKNKRIDRLIRVTAKLSRDFNLQVLILGDGPERANLENLARYLGLENIIFKGWVSPNDMPLYMAASDVLVLPSESEGLPGCVQEAMACGISIVASNVGGLPDLITNGVNGYLVDNEAEMEERLRLLMSSPELRNKMGANAREFARQNLSIDKVVNQTEELYAAILDRKLITPETGGML